MVKIFYKDGKEVKSKVIVPKKVCDDLWEKLKGVKQ